MFLFIANCIRIVFLIGGGPLPVYRNTVYVLCHKFTLIFFIEYINWAQTRRKLSYPNCCFVNFPWIYSEIRAVFFLSFVICKVLHTSAIVVWCFLNTGVQPRFFFISGNRLKHVSFFNYGIRVILDFSFRCAISACTHVLVPRGNLWYMTTKYNLDD